VFFFFFGNIVLKFVFFPAPPPSGLSVRPPPGVFPRMAKNAIKNLTAPERAWPPFFGFFGGVPPPEPPPAPLWVPPPQGRNFLKPAPKNCPKPPLVPFFFHGANVVFVLGGEPFFFFLRKTPQIPLSPGKSKPPFGKKNLLKRRKTRKSFLPRRMWGPGGFQNSGFFKNPCGKTPAPPPLCFIPPPPLIGRH